MKQFKRFIYLFLVVIFLSICGILAACELPTIVQDSPSNEKTETPEDSASDEPNEPSETVSALVGEYKFSKAILTDENGNLIEVKAGDTIEEAGITITEDYYILKLYPDRFATFATMEEEIGMFYLYWTETINQAIILKPLTIRGVNHNTTPNFPEIFSVWNYENNALNLNMTENSVISLQKTENTPSIKTYIFNKLVINGEFVDGRDYVEYEDDEKIVYQVGDTVATADGNYTLTEKYMYLKEYDCGIYALYSEEFAEEKKIYFYTPTKFDLTSYGFTQIEENTIVYRYMGGVIDVTLIKTDKNIPLPVEILEEKESTNDSSDSSSSSSSGSSEQ